MPKLPFLAKAACLLLLSSGLVSLVQGSYVPLKRAAAKTPALDVNFPDPTIIKVDNIWYAFATSVYQVNVQVAASPDFEKWALVKDNGYQIDALPQLGNWVGTRNGNPEVWAPGVIELGVPGKSHFGLYYSAIAKNFHANGEEDTKSEKRHCIGFANSTSITGPYTDVTNKPLFCPVSEGGAIDAAGVRDPDSGRRYVTYKVDGNALGTPCSAPYLGGKHPTPIMLQEVDLDGHTLIGDAQPIMQITDDDGPLIEAPSLVVMANGQWQLYFSSHCFTHRHYDVKYAISTTGPWGPYTRAVGKVKSQDSDGLASPGSATLVADLDHSVLRMAYHAGHPDMRKMYTDKWSIQYGDEGVVLL